MVLRADCPTLQLGGRHLPCESLEELGVFTLDQCFPIGDTVVPSPAQWTRVMKVWKQLGGVGLGWGWGWGYYWHLSGIDQGY